MKYSLGYRLTLLALKLKGIKKDFSEDPIDYQKIRKEDVFEPKSSFLKQFRTEKFKVLNSTITAVGAHPPAKGILLFVHGGAFISGPGQHHWTTLKSIAKKTDLTVWMCNYPKAPEHNIAQISENMDAIFEEALRHSSAEKISMIGDSAGGTLITAMTQRRIKNQQSVPKQLILVSPVMDSSMSNSDIDQVDEDDPMLSKKGVLSAKKMCADHYSLTNEMISPLFGSFSGFPKTVFCAASRDVTYPDQLLAIQKLKTAKVDLKVLNGEGMPHIWPFLPVMKEAKLALDEIILELKS